MTKTIAKNDKFSLTRWRLWWNCEWWKWRQMFRAYVHGNSMFRK